MNRLDLNITDGEKKRSAAFGKPKSEKWIRARKLHFRKLRFARGIYEGNYEHQYSGYWGE